MIYVIINTYEAYLKSLKRLPQVSATSLTLAGGEKLREKGGFSRSSGEELRRGVNQTQVYFQTWARRLR